MDKPPNFYQSDYMEFSLGVDRTPGDTICFLRELSKWSKKELESLIGVPQTTIPAIENNRQNLRVERTKVFAKVFKVHPSVILFTNWKTDAA